MNDTWQTELAEAFTRLDDLLDFLGLERAGLPVSDEAATQFRLRVPRAYAARMKPGDPADPLLLQVLPLKHELEDTPGYRMDPVGDLAAVIAEAGLLQKYQGRVLMITTGACAVHCRYCFRRHFPYADHTVSKRREQEALDHIAGNPDIREVIMSGGDPWVLTDTQFAARVRAISQIPQVVRLRLHTRLPVVLPARITEELLETLQDTRLEVVVVIHANHPRELDAATAVALKRLARAGCHLLNQSVLLKGINDCPDTLVSLSETLLGQGVMPYYLHLLDRATGTAHFEVGLDQALDLIHELRCRLPGYLVPRLVREESGQPFKTPFDRVA